jgi:hypothetical protein
MLSQLHVHELEHVTARATREAEHERVRARDEEVTRREHVVGEAYAPGGDRAFELERTFVLQAALRRDERLDGRRSALGSRPSTS